MEYTPEQQDIIRRLGEVNKQIDEATAAQNTAQAEEAGALTEAVRALTTAMTRSAEIHRLCRQHGDLFREFLDTLV